MIRDLIEKVVNRTDFNIEHPEDFSHGDYSTNVAMVLGKANKENPKALAEQIKAEIEKVLEQSQNKDIEKVEVAGPGFINFYLSKAFFRKSILEVLEKKNQFGKGDKYKNQIWAIEYASPNPNKAMHLGHMRNSITGVAVCNILESNSANVIREMVDNNRGIAIAKVMWGYLVSGRIDEKRIEDIEYWKSNKNEWHTTESINEKPDRFADRMYVVGSMECEDSEVENRVRKLVIDWEAGDDAVRDLWATVLNFSYIGQTQTLGRLGARFDYVWHESDHFQAGKEFVVKGLKSGIFKKTEDGAVLTDLGDFGLTDTIVEKKDGTALYITQDLALTELKKNKHKADKMVWVIGPEQSLAMQQMFAVCEQLGIGKREEFSHIAYGYVSIKGQGKMSSRAGNVAYADDLLDEIKNKVQMIMTDRVVGNDLDSISEKIAKGVVVFEMLKMGRMKDVAFDFEKALSFEGDSGPYLQYSVTRAHSALRKADEKGIFAALSADDLEITDLEKMLYRFPEVVARAGEEFAPQIVTTYLTELAGLFNSWYGNHVIVSDEDNSPYRVALTKAFTIVMENGLSILAIPVPDRM